MNNSFVEIKEQIEKANRVLIAGHKNPDGDCIGSTIAMGLKLMELGKEVTLYTKSIPEEYYILKGAEQYTSCIEEVYDTVIVLDCADMERLEIKDQLYNAKTTISMDHHINNPNFADFNYVEETSSATSEIVFLFLKEMYGEISSEIASALYAGIISDTGLFQNKNTTARTHRVVAELMDYKVDFTQIIDKLFHVKTFTETKLIGKAIKNAEIFFGGKVILSTLSLAEIVEESAKPNETSNIINVLREVQGTEMAIFIYEPLPNNVKISLRCNEPYNVYEIATQFGGGGHILAAGAIVKTSLQEAKEMMISLVEKQLNEVKK